MTENEIKEMLKDIIDNGAEYEYTCKDSNGDYCLYRKYKLGMEIYSYYEFRKVEKWYVIHEGKTEDGDIVYCRQSTFEKYYASLNKEIFFKGTEEECKKWIEEHTKKTWLEKEIHRLAIAEDDIRVVAYSVCKKILEEMENRDLSYVSATTLRNIFKDLGVELC